MLPRQCCYALLHATSAISDSSETPVSSPARSNPADQLCAGLLVQSSLSVPGEPV